MSSFQGVITKTIFKSDNNYMVLLFKVLKNDLDDSYNNKTITITGYFYDTLENTNLEVIGELTKHLKYGMQLNVSSYKVIVAEDKNSIIKFFTSDLFKGIGEAKALKIYEALGDDAISKIKSDSGVLDSIESLSKKNKETIKNKIEEMDNSSEIILKITDLGFSIKESTLIYKYYKEETLSILENNLYDIYYDLEKISFQKVDLIARKNNYLKDDIRRIEAGIIETMNVLSFETGNTIQTKSEIFNFLKIIINYLIPEDLFLDCLNSLIKKLKIMDLGLDNYELLIYYEADNNIVKRLTYLKNKPDTLIKETKLDKMINNLENVYNIKYDDKQKEAIKLAFLKNFLIISGGPGTGKTTIIKSIVSMYEDFYSKDDIVLLAPTGRASKRIMEATNYPASTIHRFLKWNKDTNKFQVNEYNKSDCKIVIVDEVSMLDTILFSSLLKGLKFDTILIMVGDANQLPSVSPGNILKDLIESEVFSVVELNTLYRQKKGSNIIELAHDVNLGEVNYNLFNKSDDLFFYKASSIDIKENLTIIINKLKTSDYLSYQIMAPMYKTLNGINNLNKCMQELLNPKESNKNEMIINDCLYREGDKVLQLMNMPDDNIYNGDIGIIIEINNILKEITIDFDSNIVTFNSSNFQNFTLGYVISIHKSQGSEFNTVVIPILNEYGRMLYKKLIYTGITRAKNKLILLGEINALNQSVINEKENNRKTNLVNKIKERYNLNV
ncbi:MAG: ATP-dependent RecD-like DNA helicase [Erysipelotrichaceae bacterium]|nr:ATP-dependent RecD-like DNA helicase [Erysipelotrichaceae bacterium]